MYRAIPAMALLFEVVVSVGLGAVLLTCVLAARAALTGQLSRWVRPSTLTFAAAVALFFVLSWTGPDNQSYCSSPAKVTSAGTSLAGLIGEH